MPVGSRSDLVSDWVQEQVLHQTPDTKHTADFVSKKRDVAENGVMMKQVNLFQRHKQFSLLLLILVLGCISCAHQPRPESYDPPGFFSGLFHGFTILFSLIGSIFIDIRIYSFPNSGFFYDLGFLIGVAGFVGGAGASSYS